jgi:hypothetical protein
MVRLEEPTTTWLSGAILTLHNKLVFPMVWFGAIGGLLAGVYIKAGRISVAGEFRFIAAFTIAATAFMVWISMHIQRVGYRGRKLIVANYWREAEISFEQVEAVEPVWWYKGRMVRIRFRQRTGFGYTVYYLCKWGPLRAMFSAPEEELREILRKSQSD